MTQDRRDFIKSSLAITCLLVSKETAFGADLTLTSSKIGVVHSTGFESEFRACFLAELKSRGWGKPPASNKPINVPQAKNGNGQYGGNQKRSVLQKLIKDHGSVNLIVAGGGLVSQASALDVLSSSQIPFIYVGGRASKTASPDGRFCGVNLNTSGRYAEAVSALERLGANRNGIYLAQNFNSEMADDEFNEWPTLIPGNNNRFRFFEPQQPQMQPVNNDAAKYVQEVARLRGFSPTGVVVSSDPYFRFTAPAFRTAMSALGIPICYPSKEFLPANRAILLPNGAKLSSSVTQEIPFTAYYQLGLRAADILDNQPNGAVTIPTMPLPSVTWNGSVWT